MNHRIILVPAAAAVLITAISWLDPALPVDSAIWHNRFDGHFRKNAKHYFGAGFDWRWFKAQGIAESSLRAKARSARGALGVMQLIPTTFQEVLSEHALLPGILDARWNIAAGVAYNRHLYERWSGRVPATERLAFTFASYHAGYSRIMSARKRAAQNGAEPGSWLQVSAHAPAQTQRYVRRIERLMAAPG